jgi:hypothetical protein
MPIGFLFAGTLDKGTKARRDSAQAGAKVTPGA